MGLQKYFEDFNKKIKMDYDELSELADKRDILIKKLRNSDDIPSFEEFNQGSYSMYTGVEPLDKEYDIDVGLKFNVNKSDYEPLDLKEKIQEVLKNHTEYGADIKQPCVTVKYKKDGEIAYHIDLVVYAYEDKDDKESQMYLARGKKYSNDENKKWEEADPINLKDTIMNKWEDKEIKNQYRRMIRYLKRWKNIKFRADGNSEPPGIGITLLAYEKFEPQTYDWLEEKYIFDDLEALIKLVGKIKSMFTCVDYSLESNRFLYKIEIELPVAPKTNVFSKMTNIQMTNFKDKIDELYEKLIEVRNEAELVEQCKLLNKIFGDDFEVPSKEETAKNQSRTILTSSTSGKR
ncbi:nucleotidyltransferase [Clostridium perfringens]|uniref:nucleotidyltransferase domain-containing protein n=2 Tax=Clostridium perfringens TaxID=1502 RepID=UPI001F462334|nr:nucleotidyltransferase [Clostridium perfringens]EJT5918387.1 nucleotidyltransferase [Clostridium perfringens]MDH5065385.1 hypothetical protein [Clostridium perfringens]MDM0808795.1 nucleotidyltransferase [Clostridium perfringens]MDM0840003.1 nucleotidyltransferase [Clostridium perfringens]UBL02917.1 nucleotidyltransferase [Clostridium perfringens]